ncbi:hypothetical protein BDK51DRAFT_28686 [Blyttiomyces helicus]|uniref:Uncharacterized protein n=1 Tax=Blyttiomyces helicus TaxID=388810 RepID=A0A4P9WI67_9FUNG|nr:hypothetical protein BDK51DRAFT_28686 [Blyttiomyces helicus]|eukprot:RKO91563.1 hypothetical protein BDK51DRAFT_28686 [Blyttiomyces helicus]
MPRATLLTCHTCDAAAALKQPTLHDASDTSTISKKKKHPPGVDSPLYCSACKEETGVAFTRILNLNGDRGTEDCVEPEFELELVCKRYWARYKFCSAVGREGGRVFAGSGGGSQYRKSSLCPNKLSSPTSKSCNVSHDHIGMVTFTHQILACPEGLSPSIVTALTAVCEETAMKRNTKGKLTESRVSMSDFTALEACGCDSAAKVCKWLCAALKQDTRRFPLGSLTAVSLYTACDRTVIRTPSGLYRPTAADVKQDKLRLNSLESTRATAYRARRSADRVATRFEEREEVGWCFMPFAVGVDVLIQGLDDVAEQRK